jgi:hypothetical protein
MRAMNTTWLGTPAKSPNPTAAARKLPTEIIVINRGTVVRLSA